MIKREMLSAYGSSVAPYSEARLKWRAIWPSIASVVSMSKSKQSPTISVRVDSLQAERTIKNITESGILTNVRDWIRIYPRGLLLNPSRACFESILLKKIYEVLLSSVSHFTFFVFPLSTTLRSFSYSKIRDGSTLTFF